MVGEKEQESKSVNVRSRENQQQGELSLVDLVAKFAELKSSYKTTNEL